MKRVWLCVPLFFCVSIAHAQSALDFAVGFGSAWDSASGAGIDNANSPLNPFGGCVPNTGDSFCQATSSLSGFMLGFSGDIMFKEHFGAGAEVNFNPTHQNYGPLQYRQTFADFNGIYEPIVKKRAIIQLQGGIGSSTTGFIVSSNECVGTAVCSNFTQAVGSSSHFQVHVGVGVQIAITDHIFIRPQFDYHYVPGLTDQFGRDSVPSATVWLGYHFGER